MLIKSRHVDTVGKAVVHQHTDGKLQSSDEGEVFWIPRNTLPQYTLANDFEDMLRIFESNDLSEFYYYKESDNWQMKLL